MREASPDLYSMAYQEDSTPTLHRLRIEDPVHRTKHGYWFLTRYDDIKAALRDPRRPDRYPEIRVRAIA